MNYKEMKQAVSMLHKEWNLGNVESKAEGDICAWIYLLNILKRSERVLTCKEGGRLLGFAAYSNEKNGKNTFRKKLCELAVRRLYKSPKIKDLAALKTYEENYDYMPDYLKGSFGGEVTILMVDEACRGKKIGKKLMLEIFEAARGEGIKSLYLLTDESCGYEFYDSLGFKCVYETTADSADPANPEVIITEKAFIYEKEL